MRTFGWQNHPCPSGIPAQTRAVPLRTNRWRTGKVWGSVWVAGVALAAGCAISFLPGCTHEAPQTIAPKYSDLPERQVPDYLDGTIMQRSATYNTEPMLINNYGLVVNLHGTGDSTAPSAVRAYMIRQMVKHGFGSKVLPEYESLDPDRVLMDKRVAIVRVDGLVPPGARSRQTFDVQVSALEGNSTTSLAHGKLYFTDLFRNGADPRMPGSAIDVLGVGEGYLFVNPVYALDDEPTDPKARASLRYALIPGGGTVQKDRPILIRLRRAQLSLSRAIEYRVNDFFQRTDVARAYDEGLVQLFVPETFDGDWKHFVGLVNHLYLESDTAFNVAKARQLADAAQKPNAPLEDISYAWEGLGNSALPIIVPLMSSAQPDVAYAAARAAACIGDQSAVTALGQMAQTGGNPFQLSAVQTLGILPRSPQIDQMLRSLIDTDQTLVRVEAYRILADHQDSAIYSTVIHERFALDIVPSQGPPLVWASRTGVPRIAVFGQKPALRTPMIFAAINDRLTISAAPGEQNVHIFYRDPTRAEPISILSRPDVAEIVARLGGEGPIEETHFNFDYGDIVAILQALADRQLIYSQPSPTSLASSQLPVPFVLQAEGRLQEELANAPIIEQRPQGEVAPDIGTQVGEPLSPALPAATPGSPGEVSPDSSGRPAGG
jgi:hypothetical protein